MATVSINVGNLGTAQKGASAQVWAKDLLGLTQLTSSGAAQTVQYSGSDWTNDGSYSIAFITSNGGDVRVRLDGSAVTATTGFLVVDGSTLAVEIDPAAEFSVIDA